MKKNLVYDKAFSFSIEIVSLYKNLCNEKHEFSISKQILRSGTSIAANIKESYYAQSKKDFLSKMTIALKEASETEYWLELLIATNYINKHYFYEMHTKVIEIIRILTSITRTTKEKLEVNS